jgi:hypothetical protein
MTECNQQIKKLIERISTSAQLAQSLALDDTSRLLAMVLLDLETKLHAISSDELRGYTRTVADVVEFRTPAVDTLVESEQHVEGANLPILG